LPISQYLPALVMTERFSPDELFRNTGAIEGGFGLRSQARRAGVDASIVDGVEILDPPGGRRQGPAIVDRFRAARMNVAE
jgi:hypothetical protein